MQDPLEERNASGHGDKGLRDMMSAENYRGETEADGAERILQYRQCAEIKVKN